MEVYNKSRRQITLDLNESPKFSSTLHNLSSNGRKIKTNKSQTIFGSHSKSRLRRINSIEENITNLFRENQSKVQLYLKSQYPISDLLTTSNLENPDLYSVLSDGIYVLIQGSVKMITFDEQKPPSKNAIRQILHNVFRKLRINKQLGLRIRDTGSQHVKKCSISDKSDDFFTIATFQQPFLVFQSVNDNCMCFSSDTMAYKLDEDEIRTFHYYQKKEAVKKLLEQNKTFFKNHHMLYHTFHLKKNYFRNQFKVDNVALIKKGNVKVYQTDHKQDVNVQIQKNRKLVCQLGESSLLVKGFQYEVSSHEVEILFIQNNDTFEFYKNPDWVKYYQQQKTQTYSKNIKKNLKRRLINFQIRKNQNRSLLKHYSYSGCQSPIQLRENNQDAMKQYIKIISAQNTIIQTNEDNQKSKILISFNSTKNCQLPNQNSIIREAVSSKSKKNEFLRMISPYIMISQKIGMKQIMKTRQILNERSLNVSPSGQKQRICKISKSRLKKAQHSHTYSQQFGQKDKRDSPKKNLRKTLIKFEKFLQQKNRKQYKEQVGINIKKSTTYHRKSFSELTPITSSNFHLSLKKNYPNQRLNFDKINSKQIVNFDFKKKSVLKKKLDKIEQPQSWAYSVDKIERLNFND